MWVYKERCRLDNLTSIHSQKGKCSIHTYERVQYSSQCQFHYLTTFPKTNTQQLTTCSAMTSKKNTLQLHCATFKLKLCIYILVTSNIFLPPKKSSNPQKKHHHHSYLDFPLFWMSLFGTFWCFHFYRHRFLHGQRHLLLHGGRSNGWNWRASVVQPRLLGCRPRWVQDLPGGKCVWLWKVKVYQCIMNLLNRNRKKVVYIYIVCIIQYYNYIIHDIMISYTHIHICIVCVNTTNLPLTKKNDPTTEPPGLRADGGGHTAGLEHLQTIHFSGANMLVSGRVLRTNIWDVYNLVNNGIDLSLSYPLMG